jgi:hypothetical protein
MIELGSRAVAVGKTGSGKSRALARIFAGYEGQRIVADVNDDYDLGPDSEKDGLVAHGPGELDWTARTIRYVPRSGSMKEWDRFYAAVWHHASNGGGPLLVWLDETEGPTSASPAANPQMLRKTIGQGRKKRITHLAAAQRPSGIYRPILNQSERAYFFQTEDRDDLDAIAFRLRLDARSLATLMDELDDHGFLYHRIGGGPIQREPPLTAEELAAIDRVLRMP